VRSVRKTSCPGIQDNKLTAVKKDLEKKGRELKIQSTTAENEKPIIHHWIDILFNFQLEPVENRWAY
jgi:hypothetical protein